MSYGGSERVLSRLTKLISSKYEVKIFVFSKSKSNFDFDCSIQEIFKKPHSNYNLFTFIPLYIRFTWLLLENRPDYLISFGNIANLLNTLLLVNIKKIISVRGFRSIQLSNIFYNLIIRFIFFFSKSIYSVSSEISIYIEKKYKVKKSKIHTIENGFDKVEIIDLSKKSIDYLNNKSKSNPKKKIISVGTYRFEKGYWNLLKSFSYLKKNYQDVDLVLIGPDPYNHKKDLELLALKLNIEQSVSFMGLQKNPFRFISNSDIYALTSITEGFPNAMVEAMILGLPIVAVNCPSGPNEILNPKNIDLNKLNYNFVEYGILCPEMNNLIDLSTNIDSNHIIFANALIELLSNESLLLSYSKKSKERADFYDYNSWKSKFYKLIEGEQK